MLQTMPPLIDIDGAFRMLTTLPSAERRRAEMRPGSFDAAKRTFEVTWCSERPILIRSPIGEFEEVLGLGESEVDVTRLKGAPVFYGHSLQDRGGQFASELRRPHIGVVDDFWWEGSGPSKLGVARLRLSERAEVVDIARDVESGVLTGVSPGYDPLPGGMIDITPPNHPVPRFRTVRWIVKEITLVPMQADSVARVRANGVESAPPEKLLGSAASGAGTDPGAASGQRHLDGGDTTMTPEEIAAKAAADKTAADAANTAAAANAAAANVGQRASSATATLDPETARNAGGGGEQRERARAKSIRAEVKRQGLDEELADSLVESGTSIENARSTILDKLGERGIATATRAAVTVGKTARDHVIEGVSAALENRCHVLADDKVPDVARRFVGMRMLDLATRMLEAEKGSHLDSYAPNHVAAMALGMRSVGEMGTSDFTKLTSSVATKSLMQAYALASPTYRAISQQTNSSDFKISKVVNIGAGLQPAEVLEHGEVKYGKFTEVGEDLALKTYGRLLAMTRQLLINDDTRALDGIPRKAGMTAALKENALAWAIITGNVTMADGSQLFSTAHANDLAGGSDLVLGLPGLAALQKKIHLQTDPDLNLLELQPTYLIVPAALAVTAAQLVGPITPAIAGNVNVFSGKLQVLVVPQLDASSATAWYLATAKELQAILMHTYLTGANGPMIETFIKPEMDGQVIRILHDFGVSVVDHRGIARSLGTTP